MRRIRGGCVGVMVMCAAAFGAGPAALAPGAGAATAASAAGSPAGAGSATAPIAVARAEAWRLLTSVPLPPGTNALGGEPPDAAGALSASPNPRFAVPLVSATGWWSTPEGPRAAIDYVHKHLAEVSPFSRSIFASTIKPGVLQARIRLLEGTGAIADRWLVLTATALPTGMTAMRGDVQVLYVATHDRIPARARAIRVTVTRANGNSSSFLVTARRRVTATARLIDKLPAVRPSLVAKSCPAAFGTIRMGFLSSAHAHTALAVATATIGGCGGVELTIRGKAVEPELQGPGAGVVVKLERVLGRSFPAR